MDLLWSFREAITSTFPECVVQTCIVHLTKVDGRVLVTTLLDHRQIPEGELAALYERRWNIELDLRNIKNDAGS